MKPDLSAVSEDDLKAELERRRVVTSTPPPERPEKNWGPLIDIVRDGMREACEKGYLDDDFKHYIYEAAMEAVYGTAFWDWRNKQKW